MFLMLWCDFHFAMIPLVYLHSFKITIQNISFVYPGDKYVVVTGNENLHNA